MEYGSTWRISAMTICGDLKDTDSPYQYGEELTNLIKTTYNRLEKSKIKNPQILHKLIQKHGNIPAFKNYLVIFYIRKGKSEKARAANRWLLKEHPDYLFGKLNLCAEYLEDNKLEEIPMILGDALTLDALYPEREIFHINEFTSFMNVSIRYLIHSDQLEVARQNINMLAEVLGDEHDLVRQLDESCAAKEQFNAVQPYISVMEKRFDADVFTEPQPLPEQTDVPPEFIHPQINHLYCYGLDIEEALIEELLQLPRKSLIEDLEMVLKDAVARFEYFINEVEAKGWKEVPCDFLLHALALLGELRAKETMPTILKTLTYDWTIIDFYLGDHLFETIWQFIYKMYDEDITALKAYLIDPGISSNAKLVIMQVITQIGLLQPKRKESVARFYEELIDIFFENLDDPRISDYNVLSSLVAELCDLRAERLLPKIKLLFDLELVDLMLCGDYEAVAKDIKDPFSKRTELRYFDSITDLYKNINATWSDYVEREQEEEKYPYLDEFSKEKGYLDSPEKESDSNKKQPVIALPGTSVSRKVGRNEPCPCGSGNKFKRCCLKN